MTLRTPEAVVFDIGGVLIDWKPHLAWMEELGTREAVEAFMARVDFGPRNARGDAGERFADMATEIADAEDAARLARYVDLYPRTVMDRVEGTWTILEKLKTEGIPLHAITNWSAETWPRGLTVQPRLGEVFGTLVVSGEEKMIKPDARIFETLCNRAGLAPEVCVFIDDSLKNVAGAKAVGMDAIHFTSPDALASDLRERGLPV